MTESSWVFRESSTRASKRYPRQLWVRHQWIRRSTSRSPHDYCCSFVATGWSGVVDAWLAVKILPYWWYHNSFLCPLSLISCLNDKWTLHLMCHVSWYQWRTWWRRFQGMPAAPPSYDASMAASGAGGFAPPPPPGQVHIKCQVHLVWPTSQKQFPIYSLFPHNGQYLSQKIWNCLSAHLSFLLTVCQQLLLNSSCPV